MISPAMLPPPHIRTVAADAAPQTPLIFLPFSSRPVQRQTASHIRSYSSFLSLACVSLVRVLSI